MDRILQRIARAAQEAADNERAAAIMMAEVLQDYDPRILREVPPGVGKNVVFLPFIKVIQLGQFDFWTGGSFDKNCF